MKHCIYNYGRKEKEVSFEEKWKLKKAFLNEEGT